MTERNYRGRQIWFKRVLGGYMPCHPIGLFVLIGLILFANGGLFLGQWLLRSTGLDGADDWPFLLIPIAAISSWIIAERHS